MVEYIVAFGFFVVFWVISSLKTDLSHLEETVDNLRQEINELKKEGRELDYLIEELRAEVISSRSN
tara:strand:+ start:184 stop:381 length:198 start_codon:yes stop_codon:yes gene_type:complete